MLTLYNNITTMSYLTLLLRSYTTEGTLLVDRIWEEDQDAFLS